MRLSRQQPPEDAPQGQPAAPDGPAATPSGPAATPSSPSATPSGPAVSHPASLAAELIVEDALELRIRMPTDLLRCVSSWIEIALLVGLGLLAKATASGVEVDVVGASHKLPKGLVSPLHDLALIALIVLPIALAVRLVIIGQLRPLLEAAVIGLTAAAIAVACNLILRLSVMSGLYHALASQNGQGSATLLDPYLAALAAYLTVIGLSGRQRWRTWFWLAIGFYCLTSLAQPNTRASLLSLLIALLIGSAVGSGLRYVMGTNSERPTAAEIAAALGMAGVPLVAIRRAEDSTTENRRYQAVGHDGARLDLLVFDRDQQAADALYRIYRRLRLTSQVSRSAPVTVARAVERRTLMAYAVEDSGVPTPALRAALRVGAEAAVIASDHHSGTTLAELATPPSDHDLGNVFDAVLKLHRRRVTHRSLTADHILLTGDGEREVMLLEPGDGDVAASDLQLRLDLAQLTASIALLVGPERAADLARHKLGTSSVGGLVPLLQPVVLHRSTRSALRRRKDVLPALRKGLLGSVPPFEAPPVQLERIRPRAVITLVAAIVAGYIVIGQLGRTDFRNVVQHSDWSWLVVALGLSAVTYIAAAWSLSGFVLEKLSLFRTFLAQLAGSFVTLVTPAAVGSVALNIRYLHRAKVAPADAASSVGVSQVFAFALHLVLLVIFLTLTGGSSSKSFKVPSWAYIALIVLGAAVLVVFALPACRRLVRSRVAPALGQVVPRLLDIAQRPAKLTEGVGGALLLTLAYILCLDASLHAVGGHATSFAALAVVYLTGSALGAIVPTPGGLGAVEVALSSTLTAVAHVPGPVALSAVLLFRLLTFWLPIPVGWAALNYLQRHDAL